MKKQFFGIFCIIILIASCVTYSRSNPYPNKRDINYNGNTVYEFRANNPSDRIIIVLEGSGWNSSLGFYSNNRWEFTEIGALLIQVLRDTHTLVIPEKWNRSPENDYFDDLDARYIYTKENLVENYVSSINGYLNENNVSSIVLVGTSEGAALLPFVYENMDHRELVAGMVSIAFGGLSIYESYKISLNKDDVPEEWKHIYALVIESLDEIMEHSDSIEKNIFGVFYRQLASFIHIRPFDYYKNIDIPVLFIHGRNDWNMAVESTEYIQSNLPEKPYTFIIYKNMGHIPTKYFETRRFRNDIAKWIQENNL